MRILLITGSFPPMRCGVGDYTHQLAMALARDTQLQVAVLTSREAAPSVSPDFVFFPVVETWNWRELNTILDVIRKWAPDLVHIQYPTLGYGHKGLPWLLPLCLRLAGYPVVQTWHEIYLLKFLFKSRFVFRFIAKAVVPGGLVVVREDYQRKTEALLRWVFLNKTVRFIPNASVIPTVKLTVAETESLRAHYARPNARMIAYFGFIYPRKRVELLFQIADASDSHLVIIGDSFREEDLRNFSESTKASRIVYHQSLRQLAEAEAWKGKVTMSGFLPNHEAARVIAAADAVVLPILDGGGGWNTSVHGAQAQGTFVLTTSNHRNGYDPEKNTYFAGEHDLEEMKRALKQYVGKRSGDSNAAARAWQSICESHIELYRAQISPRTRSLFRTDS